MDDSASVRNWIEAITLDMTQKGAVAKQRHILNNMVTFTSEQKKIIDTYLMEEMTGKRHWEWDPDEPDILMDLLYGTHKIRVWISQRQNMTARQKTINNMIEQQNAASGNSNKVLQTSSGQELTPQQKEYLSKRRKRNHR